MLHLDTARGRQVLTEAIREPDRLRTMTPHELSALIDAAWDARLLGWLLARYESSLEPSRIPSWLRDRFTDVDAIGREAERSIRWEIDRIARAFSSTDIPVVLLKGAGYVAARLAPGRARQVADIDVLVPESRLGEAEAALQAHGWAGVSLEEYDERYYRTWTHELPPMVHAERRSVVDLHHGILPRTSRLHPPAARLIERSIASEQGRVLCRSHMVLHAAAHLFHDGEVAGAIRDLVDIDGLLRTFGPEPGFWRDWLIEARELDLVRPAFYTVRYAARITGTPIPADVMREAAAWAPQGPVLSLMDALVERAMSGGAGATASYAAFALYVRAHWLRMPPGLLVRHLARKAFVRR